jgi:hypothetical protein
MVTYHAREDLEKWLRRGSTDADVRSHVQTALDNITLGYGRGLKLDGAGIALTNVERALRQWISDKQRDPRSIYSIFDDR